jgi:RES domain-containing protein
MARRLDHVPVTTIDAIVWRYSNYDTPFWSRSNTRDGRWHTAGELPVQYLSLEPNGAWAELIRAENLTAELDVSYVRMPLWVAALTQGMLADYRDFAHVEQAGFPPDAIIDDDWERCQHEGGWLRDQGIRGVIAPSAALPGATNVTIFGARIAWRWNSVPAFASAIPATVAAVGSPPPGLVHDVRRIGDAHTGYDEYRRIRAVEQANTERKPRRRRRP